MNRKNVLTTVIGLLFFVSLVSCSKDDNDSPNARVVKYEITGNFTGKLTVIYNDNVSGNTVLNDVTLPWSKDITYPATVTGIGIGAQSSTAGTPGQTATMKIYSGGTVVKNVPGTAGSLGEMILATTAYTF